MYWDRNIVHILSVDALLIGGQSAAVVTGTIRPTKPEIITICLSVCLFNVCQFLHQKIGQIEIKYFWDKGHVFHIASSHEAQCQAAPLLVMLNEYIWLINVAIARSMNCKGTCFFSFFHLVSNSQSKTLPLCK